MKTLEYLWRTTGVSKLRLQLLGTLCAGCGLWVPVAQGQDPLFQQPGLDVPSIPGLIPNLTPPMQDSTAGLGVLPGQNELPGFEPRIEVKKVNDSVAGWNSAEAGRAFNLGETLRRHWVMVDSEGKLRGQIMGSEFDHSQTEVYFLHEGRMIEKVSANANGEFIVFGLEQAVYTLLVATEGRYAVNCLIVLDNNPMGGPPSSFNVPLSDPSPRSVFEQVVTRATKVTFRNFGEFAFGESPEDPPRLYGMQGITAHRPTAADATTLGNNRVHLTSDGQLIGRLRAVEHLGGRPVDLMVTEVLLIAKDETIHTTQTNRYGIFQFDQVQPGVYTLFAAGKDGLAVTSFELLDSPTAPAAAVEVQSVGFRPRQTSNVLDVTLAPRRDVGWINAYFLDHVPPPRLSPVEDVPYNPYADYGYGDWGFGMPYGAMVPFDMCGCSVCGGAAWSSVHAGCFRKGCLGRLKAKCGCSHGDACEHGHHGGH